MNRSRDAHCARSHRRGAIVLTFALGAVFPMLAASPTSAQDAGAAGDPPPLQLTLDQALALAAGENPTVRRAVNDAGLNGTEMRSTWLDQLLPQASLTLFNTLAL